MKENCEVEDKEFSTVKDALDFIESQERRRFRLIFKQNGKYVIDGRLRAQPADCPVGFVIAMTGQGFEVEYPNMVNFYPSQYRKPDDVWGPVYG